jgi:hypothetical protein
MARRLLVPFLVLVLAVLSCGLPSSVTETPSPVNADTPIVPPPPAALTVDMLRNGTWFAPTSGRTVTLVGGNYQSGSDPSAVDYLAVTMSIQVAFGDLNYDGVEDAAILLNENMGGTGVFVSLIAVLNDGGAPVQAASVFIDDRAIVNTLVIQSGEILADTVIHGADDPMCCPSKVVEQGYRLYNGNELALSRWAGQTFDGQPRHIDITNPADLDVVTYPLTVSGSVTVGPFENTLGYNVYAPDNALVTSGSVMTDSPDMGLPGDFSLTMDLTMAGVTGRVRIEFIEYSMADGSIMTLDSVLVVVP